MLRSMSFLTAVAALLLSADLSTSFAQAPAAPQAPAAGAPAPAAPANPSHSGSLAAPPGTGQASSRAAARHEARRPRSYSHCSRAARKRKLHWAERRRYILRCQLGYESRRPATSR